MCILVFNPVAPYRYLLPTMYLFMADISLMGTGGFDTICTAACLTHCDSSTTCRLCRLLISLIHILHACLGNSFGVTQGYLLIIIKTIKKHLIGHCYNCLKIYFY